MSAGALRPHAALERAPGIGGAGASAKIPWSRLAAMGGPKTAPDASKTAQEAPKTVLRGCPDEGPERTFRALGPERLPGGTKRPPRGPQEAPRDPREAPRKPQEAPKRLPRGPQEAPKRPQDAPKRPQERPKRLPRGPQGASWSHLGAILGPSHRACNMSPLGGSAEALWPTIFQNALKITCFKALPKRETPHIRMASHWACNMSPLGRAGAPALRAESAAPSARREHGVLDHRQTSSDSANSANSVRRSLEQGRARRQAGPLNGPLRTSFFILALGSRSETAS